MVPTNANNEYISEFYVGLLELSYCLEMFYRDRMPLEDLGRDIVC